METDESEVEGNATEGEEVEKQADIDDGKKYLENRWCRGGTVETADEGEVGGNMGNRISSRKEEEERETLTQHELERGADLHGGEVEGHEGKNISSTMDELEAEVVVERAEADVDIGEVGGETG